MSGGLPVVRPEDIGPPIREGPVGGVLLAAGKSERFGDRNKLLIDIEGKPLVRRAALTLTESSLDHVIAVVGYEATAVEAALSGLDLEVVENPSYTKGQATSLEIGTRTARKSGAAAACYALGDMPWVEPTTVDLLVRAYLADTGDPLAVAYDGDRGNPTLFDARHFETLEDIQGDVGGRELLLTDDRARLVETGDPNVRRDIDVPGDLPARDD